MLHHKRKKKKGRVRHTRCTMHMLHHTCY